MIQNIAIKNVAFQNYLKHEDFSQYFIEYK